MTQARRQDDSLLQSAPRRYRSPQDGLWHVQITQGETYVTSDPEEVLTTVLGSCIAACLRDPEIGVGGMNHFLLPEGNGDDKDAMRYGVNAMELLVNGLLKRGAARNRLEAKLFGGANVVSGLTGIGWRNAAFAEQFLANEGISVVGGDIRGVRPRRVQYWPVTGRARQLAIASVDGHGLVERELTEAGRATRSDHGPASDVELF